MIRGEGSFPLAASGCLKLGVHHYKANRVANSSRALRAQLSYALSNHFNPFGLIFSLGLFGGAFGSQPSWILGFIRIKK